MCMYVCVYGRVCVCVCVIRTLGVDRSASEKEIKDGYKRRALDCHPDKVVNESERVVREKKEEFQELIEAFTVLSHEPTRKAYDKHLDNEQANGRSFGKQVFSGHVVRSKGMPTHVKFGATLEELWSGCMKEVAFTQRRFTMNLKETSTIKLFHIAVQKGSEPGEQFVYDGQGDESPDTKPGDVICVLCEEPHARLQRMKGAQKNIVYRFVKPLALGNVGACEMVYRPDGTWHIGVVGPKSTLPALLSSDTARTMSRAEVAYCGMPDAKMPFCRERNGNYVMELEVPAGVAGRANLYTYLSPGPIVLAGTGDVRADELMAMVNVLTSRIVKRVRRSILGRLFPLRTNADLRSGVALTHSVEHTSSVSYDELVRPVDLVFLVVEDARAGTEPEASATSVRLIASMMARFPTMRCTTVRLPVGGGREGTLPLLDDEIDALEKADLVIVDGVIDRAQWTGNDTDHSAEDNEEDRIARAVHSAMWPLQETLQRAFWLGAAVAGIGIGAVALGKSVRVDQDDTENYMLYACDALVPFVVRVHGEDTGWAGLTRASTAIDSEVAAGSGMGLACNVAVVVDANCAVTPAAHFGRRARDDSHSVAKSGDFAGDKEVIQPFMVSGRELRRRAAEVEEARRKLAEEEAERVRVAKEMEERAYRIANAKELDRKRVEEGKRRQEERRQQFMEMRQQQMAARQQQQQQHQAAQSQTQTQTQPIRPTPLPQEKKSDQEKKKATRPVVAPSASSTKNTGVRNLDDFPLALHEVVELLTAVLQSVGDKSFAEGVYVETQLFSVDHSSADDGGSDSLTNIRRSPKTMMKVFGSKAKHLCVSWNADSFARFLSSVSNYINESEKVASLVTAIDDRMDLEIISSICF